MLALAACGSGNTTGDDTQTKDKYVIGIDQFVTHEALDAATQGFKDALVDLLGADKVEFIEQNAAGDPANCPMISNQFVTEGVDLIMANATPPLSAAAAATADIPILGTSITDYGTALDIAEWTGVSGKNVSGTTDLAPLAGQADMLAEIFPVDEYPVVGIIYATGEANSIYQVNTIEPLLKDRGYTVNRYAFTDSNDVSPVTQSAVGEVDVLYIPTDNTAASCTEAINNIVSPANIPVVAAEEGICRGCGVVTLTISYYDLGYKTGEMAYDILVNGADITTMAVEPAPEFVKKYNAEMATKLGITVPEDYVALD